MVLDNWLWRGFQSAVFFYVSCGPCYTQAALRKRRKEGKAAQRQRAAMEEEEPDMHIQPAPFQINPHWKEEIILGPGPPSRRKDRTGTPASRGITTAGTANTDSTAGSSLSDLGPVQSMSSVHLAGHSWNSKRYQRADEEFAYFPALEQDEEARPNTRRQVSSRGSSVGVSGWSSEPVEKPGSIYYIPARAPPVNDLHPPVVSTVPAKKNERVWMMEPPPSASFMNGKKGVTTRSRSGSGNSGNSSMKHTDASLGRQVGYKMVEDKVRRCVAPLPECESSNPKRKSTATMATGRSSPMNGRNSRSPDVDDSERTPSSRKKRPPPVQIPIFDSPNHVVHSSSRSSDVLRPTNKGNRPMSTAAPTKLQPLSANRPGLGTKSRSSENCMTKKCKDKIPIPSSFFAPSPPELSNAQRTPSPRRASSRRSGQSVDFGNGEIVDDYTPSPRKAKRRKDTKTDREGNLQDDQQACCDKEQRAPSRNRLLVKDSSLRTLQDQVEMRGLQGNKFIKSPVVEARVPLPRDGLDGGDSVLGERKRWSFDL